MSTEATIIEIPTTTIQTERGAENTERHTGTSRGREITFLPNKCCKATDAAKWIGIALIVAAAVIGTAGLLVYLNKMILGLHNVGTMSQTTGFYTMLGGYGVAFVSGVVLGTWAIIQRRRAGQTLELMEK